MKKSKPEPEAYCPYVFAVNVSQRELLAHFGEESLEVYNKMRHSESVTLHALCSEQVSYEVQTAVFGNLT